MASEKDIVLIYLEEKPVAFARIESILADIKPDWYHVKLLMLQIPLQIVTWILKDVYINGETFTMNGKEMRLERVESPGPETEKREGGQDLEKKDQISEKKGTVISLDKFKK